MQLKYIVCQIPSPCFLDDLETLFVAMAPVVLNFAALTSETAQRRCDLEFHGSNIKGSIGAKLSSFIQRDW